MKIIFVSILWLSILGACNGQQLDTLYYYTQDDIDSAIVKEQTYCDLRVLNQTASYEGQILELTSIIDTLNAWIDSNFIACNDPVWDSIEADWLANHRMALIGVDSCMIQLWDTDNREIRIFKRGVYTSITFTDSLRVMNAKYSIHKDFDIKVTDDTYLVGSVLVDSTSQQGTTYFSVKR